jgi:hypothetical protein
LLAFACFSWHWMTRGRDNLRFFLWFPSEFENSPVLLSE